MVMAALSLTVLLLFAGLALDFGRAHLLRAQLQTAVDAAALAGALQVVPMVELSIPRWEAEDDTCTDPVTHREYTCRHWYATSPVDLEGPEWNLLNLGGWRSAAGAQCTWPFRCNSPRIVREWLVLPPSTAGVAENTFYKNAAWPVGDFGARVDNLEIAIDPDKAQVTATAALTTPTSFLKLVGIQELHIARTGSAVPVKR